MSLFRGNNNMKKLAVFIPGIGYHCDRPILYFSRKMLIELDFNDYRCLKFSLEGIPFPQNDDEMHQVSDILLEKTINELKDIDWNMYDKVIFVSKSVGTSVAVRYANRFNIQNAVHILYTPLLMTYENKISKGIAFIGTKDQFGDANEITKLSEENGIPINVYKGLNHSLEKNDVIEDIDIIKDVIMKTKKYVEKYD